MMNTHRILTLAFLMSIILSADLYAQALFADMSSAVGFDGDGFNRGIALGDFDNDGDDDVYVCRMNQPNRLYLNEGGGIYTEIAAAAGVDTDAISHTSVWGDFDNDGYLDLYVGNRDTPNMLYYNNGDGTFSDIAVQAGVDELRKPRSIMAADVNQDGFLDIYVANINGENNLYLNNGDLTFTDVTQSSGTSDTRLSMGAMFFDYDNDGDQDLYLTHDGNQAYILLQNDGTGHFVDVSEVSGTNYQGLGMGVDFGDINNDGWLDIYITNLSYNTLYLNNGDGTFTNISESAQVIDPGMGWGTTFLDYDNDGLQDIYVVNDSNFSPLPNVLYRNKGDLTFEEVSEGSPIASMGAASYGIACTDFNYDGLLDILITNFGEDGNQFFENQTDEGNNWFQIKLEGTVSNRSAIGARVTLNAGGQLFVDEVCAGSGYASQNSMTLHFGLGDIETIDEMIIRWPNGGSETYTDLMVNQTMYAIENESLVVSTQNLRLPEPSLSIFPNPSSKQTPLMIEVEYPTNEAIEIIVTDLFGRKIETLYRGNTLSEAQRIEWLNSTKYEGWYIISLVTKQSVTSKSVLLK